MIVPRSLRGVAAAGGKRFYAAAASTPPNARQRELMARGLPKKRVIQNVKHVVLVASGKGGVGKSTTAVNVALAMTGFEGGDGGGGKLSVGVLDADVYGPSIPVMLNVCERPMLSDDGSNRMLPLTNYGLKCMSMGFLVSDFEKTALVWRGPMVMGALEKMAHGTDWGALDVLVVDLPPGTGDVQLSLAQTVANISGAVVVTTPQRVALADARRGVAMFEKVSVPVLGLVENMSGFACPECDHTSDVFGSSLGRVAALADELGVSVLGRVPLEAEVVTTSDEGRPIVASKPDSASAKCYKNIAGAILKKLNI